MTARACRSSRGHDRCVFCGGNSARHWIARGWGYCHHYEFVGEFASRRAIRFTLPPMMREPRFHPWLLTLLCGAIVAAQVAGLHFHLRLGGHQSGPSLTHLHFEDGGIHAEVADHLGSHQASQPQGQHDVEVKALDEGLIKFRLDTPELVLLLVIALLIPWRSGRQPRFAACSESQRPPDPRVLRPPSRGPPLHLSPAF